MNRKWAEVMKSHGGPVKSVFTSLKKCRNAHSTEKPLMGTAADLTDSWALVREPSGSGACPVVKKHDVAKARPETRQGFGVNEKQPVNNPDRPLPENPEEIPDPEDNSPPAPFLGSNNTSALGENDGDVTDVTSARGL
ncbi:hypothetical protein EYF80_021177 [Liparis tanakae]|uniref:Uncharacterized protein n=1 Tax=Liparis tanakae TaxID=230148 RepID=A0A4Z2HSJ6_9TELE|nr:hypothetical protein EYF80_021177 [Liparis tanakae]